MSQSTVQTCDSPGCTHKTVYNYNEGGGSHQTYNGDITGNGVCVMYHACSREHLENAMRWALEEADRQTDAYRQRCEAVNATKKAVNREGNAMLCYKQVNNQLVCLLLHSHTGPCSGFECDRGQASRSDPKKT